MGQRGENIDDPIRVAVPLDQLQPWGILALEPQTMRYYLACAECGNEVDNEALDPGRNVHKPRQIGPWCSRCGRRWRYVLHPNSLKAILDHNDRHTWKDSNHPTPEQEVERLPARLPAAEILPMGAKLPVGGRRREPRVLDAMRDLQEEIAEDMVRPFRVALSLRPDEETDVEGNPLYDTPDLLKMLHSQARMAERLLDRTVGTPIQRNANLNMEAGAVPGKDISMRAVDETLIDLINGDLELIEG